MVDLQRGMFSAFGFAQESTYGTAIAPAHFLKIMAATVTNSKANATDPILCEAMDEAIYHFQDAGQMEVTLRNNYEGEELLWHSLLGTYTHSTPQAGEFLHVLKYDPDAAHDFVTGLTCSLQTGATGSIGARALKGAHVMRAVIEGNPNDFLKTTFTLIGQKVLMQDVVSPTFASRLPVLGSRCTTFTMGGAAVKCNNWRITVDVPRIPDRFHYGAQEAAEPVRVDRLRATLEAEIELDHTSTAGKELLDQVLNSTTADPTAQSIDIHHTTLGTIAGTDPYLMAINGDFMVQGDEPSVQDPGIVTFNLRGTLVTDGTQDLAISYENATNAAVT